jgi:hypothetical protein
VSRNWSDLTAFLLIGTWSEDSLEYAKFVRDNISRGSVKFEVQNIFFLF